MSILKSSGVERRMSLRDGGACGKTQDEEEHGASEKKEKCSVGFEQSGGRGELRHKARMLPGHQNWQNLVEYVQNFRFSSQD